MEERKLIQLHDTLKAGAPRGRVGGLGAGTHRGGVAAAPAAGLPDSPLYRHFVKEGAQLVDVMVGVPKHEGTRMTFDDEEEAPAAAAAAAPAAAAGAFTLKRMKRAVEAFLGAARGCRAREKRVRSAALEAAEEGELEDAAAGALYERAVRKLVKKGRVREEAGELVLAAAGGGPAAGEGEGEEEEAGTAVGGGGKKKRKRGRE
jgi:hypothetical protein